VREKYEVLQWVMFQMGGLGPMLGQAHHFRLYAPEQIEYAVNRYSNEARRLYQVMDKQLGQHAYLAGENYTIADIACFPGPARTRTRASIWRTSPTSSAGSMPSAHARPCSAA
jgi:glutathione S-transferase